MTQFTGRASETNRGWVFLGGYSALEITISTIPENSKECKGASQGE